MKMFPNLHNLKQIWFSIDRRAQFYNIMKPHANNAYIMHYYTIKQHVNPKIQFKKSITAIRFGSTISYLIPIGRKKCIYPFFPNHSRKRLIELIHGQIFDESFIPLLPANNTSLGNRAIARRTVSINQDQRGHHPPLARFKQWNNDVPFTEHTFSAACTTIPIFVSINFV